MWNASHRQFQQYRTAHGNPLALLNCLTGSRGKSYKPTPVVSFLDTAGLDDLLEGTFGDLLRGVPHTLRALGDNISLSVLSG